MTSAVVSIPSGQPGHSAGSGGLGLGGSALPTQDFPYIPALGYGLVAITD